MNVAQNNQAFTLANPKLFNLVRKPRTGIVGSPAETPATANFFLVTRLHLKEIEIMKTSFRNQVRNVVALEQFVRKRLAQAASGLGGAEPALNGINFAEELSFRLPGSDEAFYIFTTTLQRKSYFLHHWSRAEPETNLFRVNLKVADMAALEQELSIILENMKLVDFVATLLQKIPRYAKKQKLAG